jgi:Polyketide cyclase / dehydrase and lipid transport
MVRKILIGVAAIFAVLFIVVATRPPTFHIERSITVNAPPEAAFAEVNDFHAWPNWSPWEKMDPGMKKTFAGAPSGAGSIYSWVGNDKVGEGRMTIEKSDQPSLVSIKLEFLKPFAATNTATFTFVPAPGGTKVTWAMDGEKNFMAKAFHMVMDMDKMVGGDFERGLTAMKAAAETSAKASADAAAANVAK